MGKIRLRFFMLPPCGLGFVLTVSLIACGKKTTPAPKMPPADTLFTASYAPDPLPLNPLFYIGDTAWLKDDNLKELSGLVTSSDPTGGFYWGEEDSGNKNAIYLLDTLGRLWGAKYLSGVFNRDWEDIAGGPGPVTGKYYIYLGDIGDNLGIFPFITIFRFVEPDPHPSASSDSLISDFDAINLVYPDGPHNAEALMVDPATRDLYILTKEQAAGLYVARYPQNTREATHLVKLGTLPIATVTAADISRDGNRILVKNYDAVYYWERKTDESIADCLQRTPLKLDYHQEPQGESIAWDYRAKSFYTISEKVGNGIPVLYHYISH